MSTDDEIPLDGGWINPVVRRGETVRRPAGPASPAVRCLLVALERAGADLAPRFLGVDDRGRDVLSYVAGETVPAASPGLLPGGALGRVGAMVRRLHDATADFALPAGVAWPAGRAAGGPGEVICHQDLAPRNTVFRDGVPVAFIDWDLASPGTRAWDLAHAAWQFVPLVRPEARVGPGWSGPLDVPARLGALLAGYRPEPGTLIGFAAVVLARMRATAEGIRALAAAGSEPHRRLLDAGVVRDVEADIRWAAGQVDAIAAAVASVGPRLP